MNWQEILTILIPLFGLMAWVYNRIDKKFEALSTDVKHEFKSVKDALHQIDMRLTRLEGRFDERGYWESRDWHKTGTDDRK